MITYILMAIITLHFVVGIGWLIYKLSPRKGDAESDGQIKENTINQNS